MKNNILSLFREFNRIRKLGWIKSMKKGTAGCGYTFEALLGKEEENFELPDYKSIEIKTKRLCTRGNINLFSAVPDSFLFLTKEIQDKYGYPDKFFPNLKRFYGSVDANSYKNIGNNYKFKLLVDKAKKVIFLEGIDNFNNKINTNVSWSFDLLKEKLERKLKFLAIVKVESKTIENIEYFRYCFIDFYKLKSFDIFIDLIEKGKIRITFKIGSFNYGPKKGKVHDHGTSFEINIKNIEKLYEMIYLNNLNKL